VADDNDIETVRRMLDRLYATRSRVPRLDVITEAETMSLSPDVLHLFALLPPGAYTRRALVDQLNSAIVAQGRGYSFGTLD